MPEMSGVEALSVGRYHACAIHDRVDSVSKVSCWGSGKDLTLDVQDVELLHAGGGNTYTCVTSIPKHLPVGYPPRWMGTIIQTMNWLSSNLRLKISLIGVLNLKIQN